MKFFECGSEFALCKTDPTKEKIVPSTGEGFNLIIPCGLPQGCSSSICYMAIDTLRLAAGFFIEEKLVHCFLNQTGVNPEQEFYFYLKRLIEVSRSAGHEISEIKLRHLA